MSVRARGARRGAAVTKLTSSESLRQAVETAASWQSAAENVPTQIKRKRVAVSLRRGLLRFVEVPPTNDGDQWIARGRGAGYQSSS